MQLMQQQQRQQQQSHQQQNMMNSASTDYKSPMVGAVGGNNQIPNQFNGVASGNQQQHVNHPVMGPSIRPSQASEVPSVPSNNNQFFLCFRVSDRPQFAKQAQKI